MVEAQTVSPIARPVPANLVRNAGFETPDLGTGSNAYLYRPLGTPWTYSGNAGVAANGSDFTSANPLAPQGDQVLFMQSASSVAAQSFNSPPGRHRILLRTAQRQFNGVNVQQVSVRVDGSQVALLAPTATSYTLVTTDSFMLAGSTHLIELVGLNPNGGDNTLFVDDIRIERIDTVGALWSNPATWTAPFPGAATDVMVPAGTTLVLDTSVSIRTLMVHGTLYCADANISLQAEWVMVHGGRLECGSKQSPMLHNFTLTLVGNDDDENHMGMGDKFLAGMSTAVIELHGEERVSWTQLAATANVGSTSIMLAESVDWRVGDQIVLAPTGAGTAEGEVATIASITGGTNIGLSGQLAFRHYGEQTPYTNGLTTWTLDERGEVGLLSRNIRIQGDAGSDAAGFGAHMMTMFGSTIHVSGIELFRVGQKSELGRYPFHWHLVRNAPGQYIENSSVHRSYNRCITVHGTHETRVEDNVCYDFIGHGYFLEDGIEKDNTFEHNLGIWAKKPLIDEEILESDLRSANASNGPAVFWISNPTNVYKNNAAAGSEGSGYWYSMVDAVTGDSINLPGGDINPRLAPFGEFSNNRVHSGFQGFSSCTEGGGVLGMEPPNEALIMNLTATNVVQGVWPCSPPMTKQNARFDHLIVANAWNGMQAPNPMTFENSLFVGYSANAPAVAAIGGGFDLRAIMIYDQGFLFDNVHFVNYDRPAMAVFQPTPGAHKLTNNRMEHVTFDNAPNIFADPDNMSRPGAGPGAWGDVVHDINGSLFPLGTAFASDHPLMSDASCTQPTDVKAAGYVCPYRYAHFRVSFNEQTTTTVLRSDGVHDTGEHIPYRTMHNFIADGKYTHSYRYQNGIAAPWLMVELYNALPGDTPVFEILDVPSTVVPSPTSGWTQAPSLNALMTGPGRRWFKRDFSIFLKMSAVGDPWHAYDRVDVCMTTACNVAPSGALPQVKFDSPADGAYVPSSPGIPVTATASHPNGITAMRLYVGNDLWASDSTPPYTFTLNSVPDGAHALKLVGVAGNGRTFTAVRQLNVGDAPPRVEILSPLDNQTFAASTPAPLTFSVHGTSTGYHAHWLIDGVDQGHPSSATISGLPQGKHEIEVALADSGHIIRAVNDRVMIYTVVNNVIADFEDGVDARGSAFRADTFMGPISRIMFSNGTQVPEASRADGFDDINLFTLLNNNDGVTSSAIYRLELSPAQDWSAFTRFRISTAADPDFAVFVIDSSAGATQIGSSSGQIASFVLNGVPDAQLDQVEAIELRISEGVIPVVFPPETPPTMRLRFIELVP